MTSYGYDAASNLELLKQDLAGANATHDLKLEFTYNHVGQILANRRDNDIYAWTGHYNLNRSYTANGLNQYTQAGAVSPTYDARGNLQFGGSALYTYSYENMLTSTSTGISLAYDPMLRLHQVSGGASGATRFQYDGGALTAEYNSSGTMLRRYVHGPGADEPLVWYEGSGNTDRRFLHADERGSIVAATDSNGNVLSTNA